jgi:PIN domain nuclease of toxin-antitoxin system
VLLWVLADDAALSNTAHVEIDRADAVYASAAPVWEISIEAALGKLKIDQRCLPDRLIETGFVPLPVTWDHANAVRTLPNLHRDPSTGYSSPEPHYRTLAIHDHGPHFGRLLQIGRSHIGRLGRFGFPLFHLV